ncbi:MAG: cysteine desulfurase-like protein [Firmicutes bacterium]|nr:cysteine desulfurase-like protein [Bacillota bacterium]
MGYDVGWARAQFPALERTYKGRRVAYLDGPGGSQVARQAISAMTTYMARGGANLHAVFPSSRETEAMISECRNRIAALLGARADEIAFGPNMTTLSFAISRALSRTWSPGDEVVVTELDHRANVDPWLSAARDVGAHGRFIPVNTSTLTLDLVAARSVICDRTKVVAVGLASNAVGTITDVRAIADLAHAVGAIVVVDAVHAAPHMMIDQAALGADILLCSAYKFFGPHMGIASIREDLFATLHPYKLRPAPTTYPEKLETGTQSHEGLAGVIGALDFIEQMGQGVNSRERLVSAMSHIQAHEHRLADDLRDELSRLSGVTVYAAGADVAKTPTVAFRVAGVHPRDVCVHLLETASVFIAEGDFYASTLAERLGIRESGGWVRAGLAPYTTEEEVLRVVQGVAQLV